jgi:hypothetical protein
MVIARASIPQVSHLFDSAFPVNIIDSPYVHVVQDDALPAEIYDGLQAEFPSLVDIVGVGGRYGNNEAVRMSAHQVLTEDRVSAQWQEFFAYHTSAEYWQQLVRIFAPYFRREFPDLEERVGRPYEDWRVMPRGYKGEADIRLDCQFVMNTPVKQLSSVKAPHVDLRDKIFSSLYYFRAEDDLTSGGDLELYAWHRKPRFIKHRALQTDIALAKTVTYAPNRFVSFVNSEKAVHGVSPRSVTDTPRRYVNMVAELPISAFRPKQISHWRKLWLSKDVKLSANNDRY